MSDTRIHKLYHIVQCSDGPISWTVCQSKWLKLEDKRIIRTRWEAVTCLRCLKKRKARRSVWVPMDALNEAKRKNSNQLLADAGGPWIVRTAPPGECNGFKWVEFREVRKAVKK